MRVAASIVLGLLLGFLVSFGAGILLEPRTELLDFSAFAQVALLAASLIVGAAVFLVLEPRYVGVMAALVGTITHLLVNEMQVGATALTLVLGATLFLYGQAVRAPNWRGTAR